MSVDSQMPSFETAKRFINLQACNFTSEANDAYFQMREVLENWAHGYVETFNEQKLITSMKIIEDDYNQFSHCIVDRTEFDRQLKKLKKRIVAFTKMIVVCKNEDTPSRLMQLWTLITLNQDLMNYYELNEIQDWTETLRAIIRDEGLGVWFD